MSTDAPVYAPSTEEVHEGRTSGHRPTVVEVIKVAGIVQKGAVVWRADEVLSTRKRAHRRAFLAWASGEHEKDAEPEEVEV